MTPSGIEPATFQLVAQCLDQMHYRVPPTLCEGMLNNNGLHILPTVNCKHIRCTCVHCSNFIFKILHLFYSHLRCLARQMYPLHIIRHRNSLHSNIYCQIGLHGGIVIPTQQGSRPKRS